MHLQWTFPYFEHFIQLSEARWVPNIHQWLHCSDTHGLHTLNRSRKKMTFRQLFFVSTKLPYVTWSVCLILDAVREILVCFRRCYPGNMDGVTSNDGGWLSYSPSPYHNLNPLPTLLIAFDHVGAASSSWGDPLVNPKAELSSCDASWIEVHPWAPVRISFYNNLNWVEIWPISFYQI